MDYNAEEMAAAIHRTATELGIRLDRLRVTVEAATEQFKQLNSNIQDAAASSARLACALNWLTGVGAVAALAGVLVAILR